MTTPRLMQIAVDLDSPALQTEAGGPDRWMIGRALIDLGVEVMLKGLTPGGVWGGLMALGGVRVGYWTVHASKDPD